MKKYFVFTVVAVLFVSLQVQAQFNWGLKGGLNLSDISSDEEFYKNSDNYTGFQVGPMLEFMVPVLGIGLDAAVLYSQTGFKVDEKTIENGNLLIPVNLKYKLSLLDIVGAYATAGPYIGFKLFGDKKDFINNAIEKIESQSFGAGLNFGIGVELLSKLQVGVNYQLGLTDDYKTFKIDTSIGQTVSSGEKSSVWSITAALFF